MKPYKNLLFAFFLLPIIVWGQSKYQINGVKVIEHGDTLSDAWVGGFNNPVVSPINLNNDGLMDMLIYDKAGWKALSFINTGTIGHPSFTYAPEYDGIYPKALRDWAVIRDYNHDGVSDIFALDEYGDISVYKGYRSGNILTYKLIYKKLWFPFGVGTDRIWTFFNNMPVITDIDGDGAIDILAPNVSAVTLNYCRNVAVDSGYSADSLTFQLESQCWGQFVENSADCNVTLGIACKKELIIDTTVRDLRHQGGACYGMHYNRNSPLVSVILADIFCNTTKLLVNTGTTTVADITSVDTLFPSYDVPVNMSLFPGAYGIDMDNDGFEDLMFAPFASNGEVVSESVDRNVFRYYHNNAGTDSINTYHYEGDTLINKGVLDVGTESHPVFFDYNGDGLMDIVLGRYGQFVAPGDPIQGTGGTSISSLYLYQNVGTDSVPVFQLVDTNWSHLSVYDSTGLLNGIYPAFGDLDGDGKPDMVVGDFAGNINFFHNAGAGNIASYPSMTAPNWFGINIGFDAAPFIYDVNGDGLNDLVIGSSGRAASLLGGHIFYYWNFGTADSPRFSPDSVNNFFGQMMVWDYRLGYVPGFANPVIREENGQTVLYSGSQRGITFKYLINTDSLRKGSFLLLDSDVLGINPGLRSNVTIADINHDGKNDYLTGNIRGGMMLFSDAPWSSSFTNAVSNIKQYDNTLQVYPNPAKDKVECRVAGGTTQLASMVLYDLLGSIVPVVINHNTDGLVFTVSNLPEGIYIVQAIDKNGNTYPQKISIIK